MACSPSVSPSSHSRSTMFSSHAPRGLQIHRARVWSTEKLYITHPSRQQSWSSNSKLKTLATRHHTLSQSPCHVFTQVLYGIPGALPEDCDASPHRRPYLPTVRIQQWFYRRYCNTVHLCQAVPPNRYGQPEGCPACSECETKGYVSLPNILYMTMLTSIQGL